MKSPIRPDQLTFESFYHSQGSPRMQWLMLRDIQEHESITPDLDSPRIRSRLATFFNVSRTKSHELHIAMDQLATFRDPTEKIVEFQLQQLRDSMSTLNEDIGNSSLHISEIPKVIGFELLSTEIRYCRLLLNGPSDSGAALFRDANNSLRTRLFDRARNNKLSFLAFYGYSGQTTGYSEFDSMYRRVVGTINDDKLIRKRDYHANLVKKATHYAAQVSE